jgi:hypothetical protein
MTRNFRVDNIKKCFILFVAMVINVSISWAQNPDLMLSDVERDSILKDYDNIFPIWGREAIEKNFDLPYPVGINANFLYMKQDIDIYNLQLSINDNPLVPFEIVQFDKSESKIYTANSRFDLWVFPFLGVYFIGGHIRTNTRVVLKEPIALESSVDFTGNYYGVGTNAAIGFKQNWLSFDINWTWTVLDKLNEPVQGRVFGIRYGRTFKLDREKRLSIWIGTMNQALLNTTSGSIGLDEAISGEDLEKLEDYENSEWYQDLNRPQQRFVDKVVEVLETGVENQTTINYSLDKQPSYKWNMLLGAQYQLNKRWQFRAEAGIIHRFSILLNANYRFQL